MRPFPQPLPNWLQTQELGNCHERSIKTKYHNDPKQQVKRKIIARKQIETLADHT
jgi:hypothetical protein